MTQSEQCTANNMSAGTRGTCTESRAGTFPLFLWNKCKRKTVTYVGVGEGDNIIIWLKMTISKLQYVTFHMLYFSYPHYQNSTGRQERLWIEHIAQGTLCIALSELWGEPAINSQSPNWHILWQIPSDCSCCQLGAAWQNVWVQTCNHSNGNWEDRAVCVCVQEQPVNYHFVLPF